MLSSAMEDIGLTGRRPKPALEEEPQIAMRSGDETTKMSGLHAVCMVRHVVAGAPCLALFGGTRVKEGKKK